MADYRTAETLAALEAPWNKKLELQEVVFDGGLALLRLRIREGRRFTTLDLDGRTAARLAEELSAWAAAQPEQKAD